MAWKLAGFDNNSWYHVTQRKNLQNIRDHGLVPREMSSGIGKNFGLPASNKGTYLWPDVGAAAAYASTGSTLLNNTQSKPYDMVILKISGIDTRRLLPDQESFLDFMGDNYIEENHGEQMGQVWENAGGFEDYPGFEDILYHLENLSASQRAQLIKEWAQYNPNEPVFYMGTIPSQFISIVGPQGYHGEITDIHQDPRDYLQEKGIEPESLYDTSYGDDLTNHFKYQPILGNWKIAFAKGEAAGHVYPHEPEVPKWQRKFAWKTKTPKENWARLMAKAQRIRLSGGVNIEYNMPMYVSGQVQGDHGLYNTEISREMPGSQTITQWHCECPWFRYSWGRTRQWKRYEGRPCSHTIALLWESQVKAQTPIEDVVPPSYRDDPEVLEQVEKLYAEEIQLEEPRIVEPAPIEVPEAPPIEEPAPIMEPITPSQPEIPNYPANWRLETEPSLPLEEENPEDIIRKSHISSIQNIQDIKTIKDALIFIKGKNKNES